MNAKPQRSLITPQQAAVHELFVETGSMSDVARTLRLSQIRVREALVQYQRNVMRSHGLTPPPLREMLRGDVVTRFGISRAEIGGRPAKHLQSDPMISGNVKEIVGRSVMRGRPAAQPLSGSRRLIVTAAETGAPVHLGFWNNLQAFAARTGAELAVFRVGEVGLIADGQTGLRSHLQDGLVNLAGVVEIAGDLRLAPNATRPLAGLERRRTAGWTVVPHPTVQLETLSRVRAEGLKVHLTSGAVTLPKMRGASLTRSEVGAVIVEVSNDGHAHCRHLLASADGAGDFQDLKFRISGGSVSAGCRVEALTFGDIHHAHLDPEVARATWKGGRSRSLVDELRPRFMVFHDVCDFEARNHHHAADFHKRFAQLVAAGGDVRREMAASAAFLGGTRRKFARSVVVGSNHDLALLRWLREADFRDDPTNAVFFLEASLALYKRIEAGRPVDGIFEQMMRHLAADELGGVRFLKPEESFQVAGVECAIHGHQASDGRRGSMPLFERLGINATLGHTHRPTTRGGIYCAGVCQTELEYARGPLTNWAVGHVVTYATGARQHLFFNGGRFF